MSRPPEVRDPLWEWEGEGLRGGREGEGEGLGLLLPPRRWPPELRPPCLEAALCLEPERDLEGGSETVGGGRHWVCIYTLD